MNVETKDLTPQLWPDLERLFGSNGACGGCWCMSWRTQRGERWADIKGAEAKRRMRALVRKDAAHGVLAYVDGEPVGWCAYGRRVEYAKLDRASSLACADAERVGSLPCFFIVRMAVGSGFWTAASSSAGAEMASPSASSARTATSLSTSGPRRRCGRATTCSETSHVWYPVWFTNTCCIRTGVLRSRTRAPG